MPPSSSVPRCIACVVLPSISPFGASLDTAILSYPPVQETGTIIPGPTLYHALVHEFGRSMVEEAIDQFSLSFADQEGEEKGA